LKILGRILDSRGDRPDPNRTQSVSRYQTLKSLNELRSFLGFANTLRRYTKNFAQIAKPLADKLKTKHIRTDHKNKNTAISLNEKELQVIVKLKTALITALILAHFVPDAPTSIKTDASYEGLGTCLTQIQDGELQVIEYTSRSLKDAEKRYHSNELEVIVVHWSINEKLRLSNR